MTAYAMLDHNLGEEIDMLRDTVQRFCEAEIAPRARDIDRDNDFPADLWQKMGALGLLGITVSETYGGRSVQGQDGEKFLQINTMGSADREIPGKVSQTLRLSKEAVEQLAELARKHL